MTSNLVRNFGDTPATVNAYRNRLSRLTATAIVFGSAMVFVPPPTTDVTTTPRSVGRYSEAPSADTAGRPLGTRIAPSLTLRPSPRSPSLNLRPRASSRTYEVDERTRSSLLPDGSSTP